jgi:hypothetical protein
MSNVVYLADRAKHINRRVVERHITSSSKPRFISARAKCDLLKSRDWGEFIGETFTCYFSPYDDNPYYLDDAYDFEIGRKNWGKW